MALEIERKFLVVSDSWRDCVTKVVPMQQGYLLADGRSAIRVRIAADCASLNIKRATLDICREEYEYEIPLTDGKEILDNLCEGSIIEKRRHYITHEGHTWEVDEFCGENDGLVVAEIELESVDELFAKPAWLGTEVSVDHRYLNAYLVKHPFREWHE